VKLQVISVCAYQCNVYQVLMTDDLKISSQLKKTADHKFTNKSPHFTPILTINYDFCLNKLLNVLVSC